MHLNSFLITALFKSLNFFLREKLYEIGSRVKNRFWEYGFAQKINENNLLSKS